MLTELDFKTDNIKKSFLGYNKEMINTKLSQIQTEYNKFVTLVDKLREEMEKNKQIIQDKDEEIKNLEFTINEQDDTISTLNSKIEKLQQQIDSVIQNNTTIKSSPIEKLDEDAVLIGEIEEPKRGKVNESHMIGSNDNDSDDFEFL